MPRMEFREATRRLKDSPQDTELARALGVPVQSVRQARLPEDQPGHRPPPEDWRIVVVRMARKRIGELRSLIRTLEDDLTGDEA